MRIYSYSMTCQHRLGLTMVGTFANSGVCLATSKDEADGKALRAALDGWPLADGYYDHRVNAFDATDFILANIKVVESANE